jgi:hypothetical protein
MAPLSALPPAMPDPVYEGMRDPTSTTVRRCAAASKIQKMTDAAAAIAR